MRSFNKVMLHGNLTSDPDSIQTKSGRAMTAFSVATNSDWTKKDGEKVSETDFHRIVAFGKLAEIVTKHLHKGRAVLVSGRLRNRAYEAKEESCRRTTDSLHKPGIKAGNLK